MPALLLVSYYFPPHAAVGAKRALRIASHLTRLGWSVQVLTVKEAYSQPLDPSLLDDAPALDVIRTPALQPKRLVRRLRSLLRGPSAQPSQHRPSAANPDGDSPSARPLVSILWDSLFSIPDEFVGWLPFALLAGRLRARRPDAVLATSPPFTCAVLGLLLAGLFRSPLILDYRDPWTASTRIRHLPRWRQKFDTTIERLSLRRAALTITTSEAIGAAVIRLGARRTRVIPNSFDLTLLSKSPPTRYSRFTIVYAGAFYKSRSAEPILRAIAHLRNSGQLPETGLALRVLGISGPEVDRLAAHLGISSMVEIEGFLPYRQTLARLRGADALLLVVGSDHSQQIPAKLFDYLAARRFILALAPADSEAGRLVVELGVGWHVPQEDPPALSRALLDLVNSPRGDIALPAAAMKYETAATMRELDRCLRAAIGHSPHPEC